MSRTVLLVSEQKLKAFTAIHENVQAADLAPHIESAQDLYLQNVIGYSLLAALKTAILGGSLTADQKLLLDEYISPMLMQYALYQALPFMKYKIVDKGVVSGTSETSSPTTLDELQFLRQNVLDTAEFYQERLRSHLIYNSSTYPEYNDWQNGELNADRQQDYFSGLVIPHKKYKYYCPDDCNYVFWIY